MEDKSILIADFENPGNGEDLFPKKTTEKKEVKRIYAASGLSVDDGANGDIDEVDGTTANSSGLALKTRGNKKELTAEELEALKIKRKEYARSYYLKNREKCLYNTKQWIASNKDKLKVRYRSNKRKENYMAKLLKSIEEYITDEPDVKEELKEKIDALFS